MERRRGWILVLEDEPESRLFYTDVISLHPSISSGFDVIAAGSVGEAMAVLREQVDPPLGALVDRWLPDGDGRAVAEYLATRISVMNINIVSADDRVATALDSWAVGATHLVKPVDVRVLEGLLARMLDPARGSKPEEIDPD